MKAKFWSLTLALGRGQFSPSRSGRFTPAKGQRQIVPPSRPARLEIQKNLLPVAGIERQFLDCPTRSLACHVIVLTKSVGNLELNSWHEKLSLIWRGGKFRLTYLQCSLLQWYTLNCRERSCVLLKGEYLFRTQQTSLPSLRSNWPSQFTVPTNNNGLTNLLFCLFLFLYCAFSAKFRLIRFVLSSKKEWE